MDFDQLRVFQAAVKSGGFTRAEELHLSQSTVSQHIKLMEEELGGPLFMRVGKRVLVTEAGSVLLQYTEQILRDLRNAEMAIREINSLRRGTVRLGVGPTTLIYRLPRVLRDCKRRFPDIDLIVLAGTTEFYEELVLVLNRGHPLARQRTLGPSDLAGLRFILYEKNTAMQDLIDRFFESLGVTPRIDMEVENNEAIKSLIRVGLGASILPLCAVAKEPPDSPLRILRVKGKPLIRELRLASAGAEILPNAILELSSALKTELCPARTRRRADRSLEPIITSG